MPQHAGNGKGGLRKALGIKMELRCFGRIDSFSRECFPVVHLHHEIIQVLQIDDVDHGCILIPNASSSFLVLFKYLPPLGHKLFNLCLTFSDLEVDRCNLLLPGSLSPTAVVDSFFHNALLGFLPPPVGWSAKPQQSMPGRSVGRRCYFIRIS